MKDFTLLVFISCLCASLPAQASYQTVIFVYGKVVFGKKHPIPVESYITLQDQVQTNINIIKIDIPYTKYNKKRLLTYANQWKRTERSIRKTLYQDKENREAKVPPRNKLLRELCSMIGIKLDQYLIVTWYKLVNSKCLDKYSTEQNKCPLVLEIGTS